MRIVRFKHRGNPRIGVAVEDGIVDVAQALARLGDMSAEASAWCARADADMTAFIAAGGVLLREVARGLAAETEVVEGAKLLAPLSPADKLICAWVNYPNPNSHVRVPEPREPLFFSKFFSALSGPDDPIVLPPHMDRVIPEAEIAVVIGKPGRDIGEATALDHVFGYTIMNDVTALSHSLQTLIGSPGPHMIGKTAPGFAPTGPWLVTAEEIPDPNALRMQCWIDDALVIDSNSRAMTTPIPALIAYLSRFFELRSGDVIVSGGAPWLTPDLPILSPGQRVRIACEGLGALENRVVAPN